MLARRESQDSPFPPPFPLLPPLPFRTPLCTSAPHCRLLRVSSSGVTVRLAEKGKPFSKALLDQLGELQNELEIPLLASAYASREYTKGRMEEGGPVIVSVSLRRYDKTPWCVPFGEVETLARQYEEIEDPGTVILICDAGLGEGGEIQLWRQQDYDAVLHGDDEAGTRQIVANVPLYLGSGDVDDPTNVFSTMFARPASVSALREMVRRYIRPPRSGAAQTTPFLLPLPMVAFFLFMIGLRTAEELEKHLVVFHRRFTRGRGEVMIGPTPHRGTSSRPPPPPPAGHAADPCPSLRCSRLAHLRPCLAS